MKQVIVCIISIVLFGAIVACKQPVKTTNAVDNFKKVYAMARTNGDYGVMANCIYNILLMDSTATGWKDSLIKNLSDRSLYESAHNLASKRIAKEPNNTILLTVEGVYSRAAGKAEDAENIYRRLFALKGEPSDGYQLAVAYYALQKTDSCDLTVTKILMDPKVDTKFVDVEAGYGGQTQRAPAKAVMLNVKGVLARAKGDNKTALMFINKALDVFPDFVLAQQQKQVLLGGGGTKN